MSQIKYEKGQGLREYALIMFLTAIITIAALMILGPHMPAILLFLEAYSTASIITGTLLFAGLLWFIYKI